MVFAPLVSLGEDIKDALMRLKKEKRKRKKMKNKELKQKLSRLQSRAYNLQFDIQRLIAELDSGDSQQKNERSADDKAQNKNIHSFSDTSADTQIQEPFRRRIKR